MSTLLKLKFRIILEDYSLEGVARHHGPLFHRWLPDGERDAISLDTGDPNAELKVWFERRGFVDNGFIRFDYGRREVAPEIIPTQAILCAGPLMGLLEIRGLSDEELAPLSENQVGDEQYIALGKKIVKEWLYPSVSRFLNILRANCGQYWIRELRKWDSREESLGIYCSNELGMKWSLDDGKTWNPFLPDAPVVTLMATVRQNFGEYLTEEDWQELEGVVREGYEPTLAALLLGRAHQLSDQGNLRYGFVEGVSALEAALDEFVRQRLRGADSLLESMQAFWTLPLPAQLTTVGTTLRISLQDIEDTIKAIDIRNKVIHEGFNPPGDTKIKLSRLLKTAAALLSGPRFKFPFANSGNAIMPLENWERRAQEGQHGV